MCVYMYIYVCIYVCMYVCIFIFRNADVNQVVGFSQKLFFAVFTNRTTALSYSVYILKAKIYKR